MEAVTKKSWQLLFIILGGLATALIVNAPAIFLGYGFAYVVMLLAAWLFRPRDAFLVILGVMLVALPFLIIPKSVFVEIAVLNAIIRPLVTYPASVIRWRYERSGLLVSALSLTAIEAAVALGVAVMYYGDDGIHAGLAVFSIFMIPFAYAIYSSLEKNGTGRVLGVFASVVSTTGFYFSLYSFPAFSPLSLSIVALVLILYWTARSKGTAIPALAILIMVAGLFYGGFYEGYALQANLKTGLYPFEPQSWSEKRWEQKDVNMASLTPTQNVFEYTHTPARLRIVKTYIEVTGTVKDPPKVESDGDYCFDIIPDKKFEYTLGIGNLILRKGALHIEVVPFDQEKVLGPIGGVCPGDVVRVKGVWVVDTDHGMWAEIHPAWEIEVLDAAEKRWPECIFGLEPE
jgi:hypothetical protein